MSDLVGDLRMLVTHATEKERFVTAGIAGRAADRIDALEAALREVESFALFMSNTRVGLKNAGEVAREALEVSK